MFIYSEHDNGKLFKYDHVILYLNPAARDSLTLEIFACIDIVYKYYYNSGIVGPH